VPFEGAGKRRRRCRRIDEQRCESFLGFTGQPQDFDIGNGLFSRGLGGSDHEIADATALNLGSAALPCS
jgi:hypothetical protein